MEINTPYSREGFFSPPSGGPFTLVKHIFMKCSAFKCFKSSSLQIKREILIHKPKCDTLSKAARTQRTQKVDHKQPDRTVRSAPVGHCCGGESAREYKSHSLQWITGVVWCRSSGTSHLRLLSLSAPGLPRGTLPHPTQHPSYQTVKPEESLFFQDSPFFAHLLNFLLPTALPGAIIRFPIVEELWTPTLLPSLPPNPPTQLCLYLLVFYHVF